MHWLSPVLAAKNVYSSIIFLVMHLSDDILYATFPAQLFATHIYGSLITALKNPLQAEGVTVASLVND